MKANWPILAFVPILGGLMPAAVMAADVELGITGQIVPGVCQPEFSQGGQLDYGRIARTDLALGTFTLLEPKKLTLTVTCNAPASFGIRLNDHRSDTTHFQAPDFLQADQSAPLGLGRIEGRALGAYLVAFDPAGQTGDGVPLTVLKRTSAIDPWAVLDDANIIAIPDSRQGSYSWTASGLTPGRYSTLTASLNVTAALAPLLELPSNSDEVVLDGSATLTLFHL
jgi:hypothetical protein